MPSVQGTQDQQNADGFPFFRPLDGGHLAASDFNPWRMLCLISVHHFCASFQENHKMPESNVWPPKPDLPDPLTEYDGVIAAKLAALSETKTGPNRILLIKALREQEGLDLRQAIAVADSYCDRHGLFLTSKATWTFGLGGYGLFVTALCAVTFGGYMVEARRAVVLRQPHHHAALLALDGQEMAVMFAFLALCILNAIILVPMLPHLRRHFKR